MTGTGTRQIARSLGRVASLALAGSVAVSLGLLPLSGTAWAKAKPKKVSTKQINSLSSAVKKAEKKTFKAEYQIVSQGNTEDLTIEQAPPKSLLSEGSTTIIDNGTSTYLCSGEAGHQTCLTESQSSNLLAALATLVSPAAALSEFKDAQLYVGHHVSGYKVSLTSATFGGQKSSCITVTGHGVNSKYCVTNFGVLAFAAASASGSSGQIELSSFSSSAPASDFSTAGATTETLPSGY